MIVGPGPIGESWLPEKKTAPAGPACERKKMMTDAPPMSLYYMLGILSRFPQKWPGSHQIGLFRTFREIATIHSRELIMSDVPAYVIL